MNIVSMNILQQMQKGGKLYFEKEFDKFIKKYPTYRNINTAEFKEFFTKLVEKESSFNRTAVSRDKNGKKGSYVGWFQLHKSQLPNLNPDTQFKSAFKHLSNIFDERIVDADIPEIQRGIMQGRLPSQAAYLLKVWNQGNNATKWLYDGTEYKDGADTKVSKYGNDFNMDLNYEKYLAKAHAPGTSYTIKKGDTLQKVASGIRYLRQPIYGPGAYSIIPEWDSLDPKRIKVGQKIPIPASGFGTTGYWMSDFQK